MAELISVRDRRIGANDRGPYRHSPDAPPSCPGCGSEAIETAPTIEGRLIGVCGRCTTWSVWRKVEGRWVVADRIGRDRRRVGQAARHVTPAASAG